MSIINPDFDADIYLKYNPDVAEFCRNMAINSEPESIKEQAILHYTRYGHKEARTFSKQQLKGKWITEEESDSSFDHEFYASEYPDALEFFANIQHISLREKLFNHYDKFGKTEGRYKNPKEKNRISPQKINISDIIPLSSIIHTINKLECVSLLTTHNEIQNGQYEQFINRFIDSIKTQESQKIDFKIIINKNDSLKIKTERLKQLFRNVDIVYLNLDKDEDLYIKDNQKLEKTPAYGIKSGPNVMFYRGLDICKSYNTTLFLETDCFFNPLWLTKLKKFIDHCNGFWISGAVYDGVVPVRAGSEISTHINGGVGLYATGNETFRLFMRYCENFLIEQIANGLAGIAYDMAIKMYIDHITDTNTTKKEDILVSKFIHRNYLPNKIIGNFSTTKDTYLKLEDIKRIYNYYIIHKK
jgi:hypothetical protein